MWITDSVFGLGLWVCQRFSLRYYSLWVVPHPSQSTGNEKQPLRNMLLYRLPHTGRNKKITGAL